MSGSIETPALIVGAGPVGLTLAMDLASRGIDVTVAEVRRAIKSTGGALRTAKRRLQSSQLGRSGASDDAAPRLLAAEGKR